MRPREIVERIGRSPLPSSRASLFGSAGKEAVLASSGVVTNAAHRRYQQRPTLRCCASINAEADAQPVQLCGSKTMVVVVPRPVGVLCQDC